MKILRLRNQCCGSGMFITDPNFSIPDRSRRIRIQDPDPIKIFKVFSTQKLFLSYRKYDPRCSSRIPDPDLIFLPIPDPRSTGQKGTGSGIRIRNTVRNDNIHKGPGSGIGIQGMSIRTRPIRICIISKQIIKLKNYQV
jgi:hypothetical protein